MTTQAMIFALPANGAGTELEEFNAFLRSHQVISQTKLLVSGDGVAYWSVFIEYAGKASTSSEAKNKVDYREILSVDDFRVFALLRDARKKIAADKKLPIYAVLNNEQLADLARQRPGTLADFKKIDGIGNSKADTYFEAFAPYLLAQSVAPDEASPPPF